VDTSVNPTLTPNPSKHAEVSLQGEQQTQEHPNTTAETSLREAEPIEGFSRPLKQTRSGRKIKSPGRLKDYVTG